MSLTMTVTNGNWIHKKFRILWKRSQRFRAQPSPMHERFDQRINAASLIVQECQQAPMRASEDDGWLSSLIVLKENQSWWIYVEGHIRHTRKGVTLSLVAQISMAFIAWLFTIAVALVGNLGDSTTALQLASGSLWLWMIPATHGWITAGTQPSAEAIRDALQAANHGERRALDIPDNNGNFLSSGERQMGILNRTGFATRNQIELQDTDQGGQPPQDSQLSQDDLTTWPGLTAWPNFSVAGDLEEAGPIYNFARLLTWWSFALTIEGAFRKVLDNLDRHNRVDETPSDGAAQVPEAGANETCKDEPALLVTRAQVADYCGFRGRTGSAYLQWRKIPCEAWLHMIVAFAVAIWLQWGTTGASIMMAFLTPVVGFSCRSGAYLLYGSLATFSCFLLFLSSLLSHAAMLRYQRSHDNHHDNLPQRNKVLDGLAVITRLAGKTIAVCNAIFLFISCIFEYSGFYGRCFCDCNILTKGAGGYSAMFLTPSMMANSSRIYWGAGIGLLILVVAPSWAFFWWFSRRVWERN
ncbi:MAG: hypothetical protein M1813_005721 [Trichoglossum hirsutum]|nr:MAG: hypothetical protein M1813_005721 [Trichoglossum hirsutum]